MVWEVDLLERYNVVVKSYVGDYRKVITSNPTSQRFAKEIESSANTNLNQDKFYTELELVGSEE